MEHPESLDVLELVGERLGDPFVIKPTEGGGGINVVLNAHGRKDICDYLTRVYRTVTDAEQKAYALQRLADIADLAANVSRMDLFSTEIAVDEDGRWVVVDAVNEMPDFRPQSRHPDGVPDAVVDRIVAILVADAPRSAGRARRFAPG